MGRFKEKVYFKARLYDADYWPKIFKNGKSIITNITENSYLSQTK